MNQSEIIAKQKEYLWPNHILYYTDPLPLDHGEGLYVWDVEGNRYLDFFGGILTTSVGHNHPLVVERVREQVGRIIHSSTLYPHQNHVALAEKLAALAPGALQTSYFTNSGTEANETAVMAARTHTGNQEIVALRHGYSGRSALAMSLTAQSTWRVGGAQAIAALAYGTERIRPVDVITGPGNAWVAEAKRQLYGVVGIDMVAGPSEIVVVADAQNDPEWIAADLLSQAEHDPTSQSILFTDNADFADQVSAAVDVQLTALSTGAVARASWTDFGAIIVVDDLEGAMPLVNRLAAEHLELAVDDDRAERLFDLVRHAGSVFLGRMTPEAIGDYVAGPNHVLPTGRRARFASGLSVLDFMKRTSFIALDRNAINVIGPAAATLADAEGLPAHAASVRKRL